jgi:outer membrane protein assembly factor BamB
MAGPDHAGDVNPMVLGYGREESRWRRLRGRIPSVGRGAWGLLALAIALGAWFIHDAPVWSPALIGKISPFWNNGDLRMQLSADGKRLAVGAPDGVAVMDMSSGQELYNSSVSSWAKFTLSPDGSRLAGCAFPGGGPMLADIDHQKAIFSGPQAHEGFVRFPPLFSPDGSLVAMYSGGTVVLVNARTGLIARSVGNADPGLIFPMPHNAAIVSNSSGFLRFEFSLDAGNDRRIPISDPGWFLAQYPDAKTVAYLDSSGAIFIRDLQNNRQIAGPIAVSPGLCMLETSGDGRLLIAASRQEIWNFDAETGTPRTHVQAPLSQTNDMITSPDGQSVVFDWFAQSSAASDQVLLYDARTLRRIGIIDGRLPSNPAFSPDSHLLAIRENSNLSLIDPATGRRVAGIHDGGEDCAWTPNGSLLTVDWAGDLYRWSPHRPAAWWGVAALASFWLALMAAVACIWRWRVELRRWYRPGVAHFPPLPFRERAG